MLWRRIVAFLLDMLVIGLGALGAAMERVVDNPPNATNSMGNVAVFIAFGVLGAALVWALMIWIVIVRGQSLGQSLLSVCYHKSSKRSQRACHYSLAWLLPALFVAIPAVALNGLSNYRGNLQRAYMDHTQARSESDKDQPEYKAKRNELEARLKRADWFAPEWLVGNDGLPWMLVLYGPLLIYMSINIALLRRPPHAALHDRITGVRITKS